MDAVCDEKTASIPFKKIFGILTGTEKHSFAADSSICEKRLVI